MTVEDEVVAATVRASLGHIAPAEYICARAIECELSARFWDRMRNDDSARSCRVVASKLRSLAR